MLDSLRSALAKPPRVHPALLWFALICGLATLTPVVVMVGYNLAAPLFHAPSMTYGNAAGLCLLVALVVGVIAVLKE